MRATKIVIVFFLVLAILSGLFGVRLIHRGFSAQDRPSTLETALARMARHLAIPPGARKAANPVPPSAENLTQGREHFADHCASCHANSGSGQTEIGQNFYPKVPDMRLPQTQDLTDGEIFYIIQNGVRLTGMPAWGGSHRSDDTWRLVLFIRHLPQLTAEEESEMERLNPKSDADRDEELQEEKFLNGGPPPDGSQKKHQP
jgi:mono/diheme cytochrome c family protein